MINLAIFASGRGSNAIKIHQFGIKNLSYKTALVVSNRKSAGVLDYAKEQSIQSKVVTRNSFYNTTDLLNLLAQAQIDLIVLAGFLWLIPEYLITAYNQKIINIHPALLPKYGGKGMYGMHIHDAIHQSGESFSGITIHYVNSAYDEGSIIFQTKTAVEGLDAKAISNKVLRLEHHFYPRVIAGLAAHFNASGKSTATLSR